MKVPYGIVTMHIEDARMRAFVEDSINENVDIFKEVRRLLSRKYMVKGFSSIQKVPQNRYKLLSKIVCEHKEYLQEEMAKALLQGWFLKNQAVFEVVNQHLIKQGYRTSIPDFQSNEIDLDTLRSDDTYEANNKSYFHPGGEKIADVDDVDVCIASALLGWVPLNADYLTKSASKNGNETKTEFEEEQHDNEESQCDEMTDEQIDSNKDKGNDSNEDFAIDDKIKKNDFELRLNQLHQDYLKTSFFLLEIVEALNNGKIPDDYGNIDAIKAFENRFNELKEEIKIHESLKINSIQELREAYQEIERENNFLTELIEKTENTLNTYKTIYHIKGESFQFFNELNLLVESYENTIKNDDAVFNEEWFKKLTEETHFFNLLIKAVKYRLLANYDDDELDLILIELEKESDLNGFRFFRKLSDQINRGNLNFKKEESPKPINPTDKGKKESITRPERKEEININEAPEEFEDVVIEEKSEENVSEIIEPEVVPFEPNEAIEIGTDLINTGLINKETGQITEQVNDELIEDKEVIKINKAQEPVTIKEIQPQAAKFSDEDSNILKLLERDEPELAYHLALCYDNENKQLFFPSKLLGNLFLSQKIRTATGPIAHKIASNLKNYEIDFEKSELGQLKNHLVFATLLRPSLIAFDTSGAGYLLNEVYSGRMAEFSELKKLIYDFMSQNGGVLNFELLGQISGEAALNEKKKKFNERLETWLERAQLSRYKNNPGHHYSRAYHNWVKEDGWINKSLQRFLKEGDVRIIKKLSLEDLEDSTWRKKYDKELKIFVEKSKYLYGNNDAFRWINNQIDDLRELLNEGLEYFTIMDSVEADYHNIRQELLDFVTNIKDEFKKVENLIDSSKYDSNLSIISRLYLKKSFINVIQVLTLKESIDESHNLDKITNSALLKISFYESNDNGTPLNYNEQLALTIMQYTEGHVITIDEIAKKHLDTGNFESYYRMVNDLGGKVTIENEKRNENYFFEQVEFLIRNTKTEIERGCAYGYILNGNRLSLISAVDEVEKNIKNEQIKINFPLRKMQLDLILQRIDEGKTRLVKESERVIPKDINNEVREKLLSYLENGNLLVFNESIERLKDKLFVLNEEKSEIFKDFFQNFLEGEIKADINDLLKSIREKKSFKGINFSSLSTHQLKEAETLINQWYFLKNSNSINNEDSFSSLKWILDVLGFKSPILEKPVLYGKSFYFDFNCTPIAGQNKTPIPQFGSAAQGKYRLICFRETLNEEDLIEDIKELTPTNNRIPIIFYFTWLHQNNRLEISKLSKNRRRTFLLLDEAMLFYLCGIKDSKLPAFIKLASPITYAEPYQTASSNLPEEMFYGRRNQIQKLKNIIGDFSCLIYGGRQLGKTVLQREVQRIFHDPEKNHFAIYIDLKDKGIGLWNKIEQISTILYENLKSIPEIFPEKEPSNYGLQFVISKLEDWFNNNSERRIILFLDEADEFLKHDARKEFQHISPLKGLMEKTGKRFKIIFSGLHNVRRTIKIPNNPLAHLGTPICVGAMLDNEEAIEAQNLIRLPLQTLGYEFESDDLVLMILSYCNWYPSLIQIFCNSLLNSLNEKRIIKKLPVIITKDDITVAYNKSRDHIKEKFNLTLGLDERYDLLANIVAGETYEKHSIQNEGMAVEEITEYAVLIWPLGFDSSNPKIEVNNLLEEMVDLGILRMEVQGKFAMRTPNLLGLFGSEKQIQENLNLKDRSLPQEFNREVSRIIYNIENREVRSPFPALYYDNIIDPASKVIIIKGSKIGGIDYIEDFLKSRKKEVHLIIPEYIETKDFETDDFWKNIEKKRVSGKTNVIFFSANSMYSVEDIILINDKINKKESLIALFLMKPETIWDVLSINNKAFEKLENQNIKIFNIPQWKSDIAKEWFRETECISADITEIFAKIGNWHHLLDLFHLYVVEKPELWKEKLDEFCNKLLIERKTVLSDFGVYNNDFVEILNELIVMDGELSKQEFIEDKKTSTNQYIGENYLGYLLSLNLIDNELKVNSVVKNLLEYE